MFLENLRAGRAGFPPTFLNFLFCIFLEFGGNPALPALFVKRLILFIAFNQITFNSYIKT